MGGLIGVATSEKNGLLPKQNAERMFNLVNKTLKIKSEQFSPCDLFIDMIQEVQLFLYYILIIILTNHIVFWKI